MNLSTAVVCAVALVPALLLSSCSLSPLSTPSGSTQPTPRPQRTVGGGVVVDQYGQSRQIPVRVVVEPSAEIKAAAMQSAEDGLVAFHRALNVGRFEKDELEPYLAGSLLASMNASDGRLLPDGYRSTGGTHAVGLDVELWDPNSGTLEGLLCEEKSNLGLLDPLGNDVTEPGGSSRFMSGITIVGLPDHPKVAEYERYPVLDDC